MPDRADTGTRHRGCTCNQYRSDSAALHTGLQLALCWGVTHRAKRVTERAKRVNRERRGWHRERDKESGEGVAVSWGEGEVRALQRHCGDRMPQETSTVDPAAQTADGFPLSNTWEPRSPPFAKEVSLNSAEPGPCFEG